VRLGWQVRDDRMEILVKDDGIGIDAEELPLVFERFVRGRRARAHRPDGTGIGLSIAQAIVRAHRGEIHLDSRLDAGTTVRIELPCRREQSA
jgi:signal transduction histidine kinase